MIPSARSWKKSTSEKWNFLRLDTGRSNHSCKQNDQFVAHLHLVKNVFREAKIISKDFERSTGHLTLKDKLITWRILREQDEKQAKERINAAHSEQERNFEEKAAEIRLECEQEMQKLRLNLEGLFSL